MIIFNVFIRNLDIVMAGLGRTARLLALLGLTNSHFAHLVQYCCSLSTPSYITGIS